MKSLTIVFVVLTIALAPLSLAAEESEAGGQRHSRTPLLEVLDALSKRSDLTFVLDDRVRPSVVLGQLRLDEVDYPSLLVILRNNGLAAVTLETLVNIVPVSVVRQYPMPVIYAPDDSIPEEAWVTWVMKIHNATPKQFVPIMRPLLTKEGHMAAQPESGMLFFVDRYANARRIAGMIAKMDDEAKQ